MNARAWLLCLASPAVAVVLGVTLLDERLGAWVLAGLSLIAVGSWLATRGPRSGRPGGGGPGRGLTPAPAAPKTLIAAGLSVSCP